MRDKNHFLTGLLLGGIAAGLGALLVAPKSGRELIDDITDRYTDLADKTTDLKHKGWHLLHPGASCRTCDGNPTTQFTVGAISGAILGATSALLLAPKAGHKLRKDIEGTYHNIVDQGEDWKDSIGDMVQQIQRAISPGKKSKFEHLFYLVKTGLNLWETIQKRK